MKELPEDILKMGFKIGNLEYFSSNEVAWATELFWSVIGAVFIAASGLNGTGLSFKTKVRLKMQYKDRGGIGPIECLVVTAKNIEKDYLLKEPNTSQYSPVTSDLSGVSLAAPISLRISVEFYSTPEALETEKSHGLNVITKGVIGCVMEAMEAREDRPVRIGNVFLRKGDIEVREEDEDDEEDNDVNDNDGGANDANDSGKPDNQGNSDTPGDSDNPDNPKNTDDNSP